MKQIINKVKSVLVTKPSNAFLLFLTGFFFTQVMLVNILYTKNPLGGWMTPMGTITTSAILLSSLFALSLCLVFLWRSVSSTKGSAVSKETKVTTAKVVKIRKNYSPIDFPRGSTQSVVSGYAVA